MTKYNRILATVDFNEYSDAVIRSALMQAECSGAVPAVLHVVDYTRPIDDSYIIPPTDKMKENLLNSASRQLEETLNRLGATSVTPLVTLGRPKQEILRVAQQEATDLIVIGAHGHHSIGDLLGSTTDRVLHRASCHVLTIK